MLRPAEAKARRRVEVLLQPSDVDRMPLAFDQQATGVQIGLARDDQAHAPDLRVARSDRGDLRRIDEHPLDLGPLVGASHPALQPHIGAAARRPPGEHGREVAGPEAHERIGTD